jgi:hypothetical protein
MNALTRIAALGAMSSLCLGTALAEDNSNTARTAALGYGSTIGGTNGVSFRYGFGGGFGFEGLLGFSDSSLTQTNKTTNGETEGSLDLAAAFDYKLPKLRGSAVAASLTGDVNYNKWSAGTISSGNETETSFDDMTIGVGMRVEYWPANWMSLNTRFGVAVSPNGEGQQAGSSGGGNTDYGGTDVETTGDFWGGAGVSFWFR